jgi:tetrahydromethanopterin S-methyltransferase subunit G
MSAKQIVDRAAAAAIIEQIDSAERKLRMIKQYVNQETGTVRDMQLVSGLYIGARDCLRTVSDLLGKFQ